MSETKADVETAKEYGIRVNEQAAAILSWLAAAKKMTVEEYAADVVKDFVQGSLSQLSDQEMGELLGINTEDVGEEPEGKEDVTVRPKCRVLGCKSEPDSQLMLVIRFGNPDQYAAFFKKELEMYVPICQAHAIIYAGSNDASSKIESVYLLDGEKGNA